MSESFLHYIWQHRLFNDKELLSDDGCKIEIIKPGTYNTSAGPDFFNAQLRIDGTLWAGNVEIHILSSDWVRHNHQIDPAYDSCILHVVYKNDSPVCRMNGSVIPTIELQGRYANHLWENYVELIARSNWVACEDKLANIPAGVWKDVFEKMIEERMENRSVQILYSLEENRGNWKETFYQFLARNFGFQTNAIPFEMVAKSLPHQLLLSECKVLTDFEALLFGQAGMLDADFEDIYPRKLREKYFQLKNKLGLTSIPVTSWKFMRMRPVNFPTIRIVQFAKLIFNSPGLFEHIMQSNSLKEIKSILEVEATGYWDTHYRFDHASGAGSKKLGKQSVNNLLMNTCIPFLYTYGKYTGEEQLKKLSIEFLSQIPYEENHIISKWKEAGVKVNNAVESQALLQLKMTHCSAKKCLTCNVGNHIISTNTK